jgi:hypothetical protein
MAKKEREMNRNESEEGPISILGTVFDSASRILTIRIEATVTGQDVLELESRNRKTANADGTPLWNELACR